LLLRGWIFDVEETEKGISVWFLDNRGHLSSLPYPYRPHFYLSGTDSNLKIAKEKLTSWKFPLSFSYTEKREFYTNQTIPVLKIEISNPLLYQSVVRRATKEIKGVESYTCDIPLPQLFFYETGLFPLAFGEMEVDEDGLITAFEILDSPWKIDYTLPPFVLMELKMEGSWINPAHRRPGRLSVRIEGREYLLEGEELLSSLRSLIRRYDPHIILSEWGDSFLLDQLSLLAKESGEKFPFDREGDGKKEGRSYFSYGRIIYSAPSHFFRGRWHLDLRNSFIINECGLDGLLELARVSKIPVQRLARLSTGTCISSMQLETALKDGYLIPYRKKVPEDFKNGEELLTIDKGGLVYQPILGFHEEVAELDFSSMYPTLMLQQNLSAETVNCRCCPDAPLVPEAGYRICQKRKGLIPKTLEPILEKRRIYKERKKAATTEEERRLYDHRQTAHKWILVTCFGFLGYRNARFGKIEAHESTTAWGREKLLLAKEFVEARGFHFLHGLTDALWVKKPGAREEDYRHLAELLSQATKLQVTLEGVYRWLSFLPSKQNPNLPVSSRYFGLFNTGELKVRGLEVRRGDAPAWVKEAQAQMLEILSLAKNAQEYREKIPQILEKTREYLLKLWEGRVDPLKLVINRQLSQDPLSYEKASLTAIVAQEIWGRGIELHPGEKIQFIITDADSPIPSERAKAIGFLDAAVGYDAEKYEEFLLKAVEPLLIHFGWDYQRLESSFREWLSRKNRGRGNS